MMNQQRISLILTVWLVAALGGTAALSSGDQAGNRMSPMSSALVGQAANRAEARSPWVQSMQAVGEPLYVLTGAHLGGFAGTNWRTDLEIHNPGNGPVSVEVALLKRDAANPSPDARTFALPPRQSLALRDVLWEQFSFNGAAALRVTAAGGGVLVSSRTYNDQPGGTYGQLVPALTVSEASGRNEEMRLVGLAHDPSGGAGSRTNLGFVNPTDRSTRVQVRLLDDAGAVLGDLTTIWVPPHGYVQIDKAFERVTGAVVSGGVAVIKADEACFAFASVIDNRTGDPVFVPARRVAPGASLMVATAAHLSGAAGTNWRTDLEVHNPGMTQAGYEMALIKRGQANPHPVTRHFTLEPGRSARYPDVLWSVFQFSGAAALRITPLGGTVQVSSRTYNQRSDGTYGQHVPGLPDALAFEVGEEARLLQLAENSTLDSGFRANVGFVNAGGIPVQLRVDLFAADGVLLGTLPADSTRLLPFEHRQIDRVLRKVSAAAVQSAYAVVSTATPEGRFYAYASVIDNRTGDPVFVPAQRAAAQFTATRQFLESSAFWNDLAMVSPTTGWAVGDPHWDQASQTFAGTISKTTDGGLIWTRQPAPVAEELRAVSFPTQNTGWAVGYRGTVLKTVDGGANWVVQGIPTTDHLLDAVFLNDQRGWITAMREIHWDWRGVANDWEAGIWTTSDGGNTWMQQVIPQGVSILHGITFADTIHGWAVGVRRVSGGPMPEHRLAVLSTIDGGLSWQIQYAPDLAISLTAVNFISPTTGWAVGFKTSSGQEGGTVLHTADGGATWVRQTPGDSFWDVKFLDGNRGYAVGMCYISAWGPPVWRTLDGGATWEKVKQERHDNDALRGLAVFAGRVVAVGDHDFVALSSDPWGEYSWPHGERLFTQHYAGVHYRLEDVFFVDEQRGWAVGRRSYGVASWGQVILHTADGGATWAEQFSQPPDPQAYVDPFRLNAVVFVDAQRGWAVGRCLTLDWTGGGPCRNAILHTSNGGLHWVEQGQELAAGNQPEFTAVQFLDAQNGWALGTGHYDPDLGRAGHFLARTADGGATWQWVPTGVEGSMTVGYGIVQGGVHFTDPQHGWAVGGLGQVIATADGGATWGRQEIQCGYPVCYDHLNHVTFSSPRTGWIAAESGFYVTGDHGETWLPRELGAGAVDYNEVQFPSLRVGWLAGGRGVLFSTPDGGMSWHRVPTPTGLDLLGMHFVSPTLGWTVGSMGEILRITAHLP